MNIKIKNQKLLKKIKYPKFYEEILDESEIIGIMLGDGHLSKKGRYLRVRVREKDFCQNFRDLVERTYGIRSKFQKKEYYECFVYSTLLVKRIDELTNNNKEIPGFVLKGDNKIKARFLRGFFDAEGSMDVIYNRRQIVLTQNNKKMLLQIKSLLWNIRIQSKYIKKNTGSDKIIISLLENLEKYYNLIGFSIKYKQEKLKEAVNYLKKCKAHEKEKYWEVLRHWLITKKSLRKSAKENFMNWETYRSWVYGMKMPCQIKKDIEFGLVPKDYEKLKERFTFLPTPNSTQFLKLKKSIAWSLYPH